LTSWQPGWSVQAVGLSWAQGVGVPVQVVAGPDHSSQSSWLSHVVWSAMDAHGVSVPVQLVAPLDQ
jgi:hypothetical protein